MALGLMSFAAPRVYRGSLHVIKVAGEGLSPARSYWAASAWAVTILLINRGTAGRDPDVVQRGATS